MPCWRKLLPTAKLAVPAAKSSDNQRLWQDSTSVFCNRGASVLGSIHRDQMPKPTASQSASARVKQSLTSLQFVSIAGAAYELTLKLRTPNMLSPLRVNK